MGQLSDILNQKRKMENEAQEEYDFDNLRTILKRKKEMDYAARQENYLNQREHELNQLKSSQRTPEQTDLLRADRNLANEMAKGKQIQKSIPYPHITAIDPKEERKRERNKQKSEEMFDRAGFRDGDRFMMYDKLGSQPDYDAMVREGQEKNNVFDGKVHIYGPFSRFNKDKWEALQTSGNIDKMTDTEKDLYYYLNGKYGAHTALNYVKSLKGTLDERLANTVHTNVATLSKNHPAVGTALDAGAAFEGGVAYPAMLVRQAYRNATGNYKDLDPNDPMFMTDFIGGGVREGVADNETLKTLVPNQGTRDFLVGSGISMAEFIPLLSMGYGAIPSIAGGSGLSGTRGAMKRGAGTNQAIELGMANASVAAALSALPIGRLKALKEAPGRGVGAFLKNVGKQAVIGGTQGTFTEMGDALTDQSIMGELSQYNLNLQQYRSNGLSEEEAKKKAFEDVAKNIALAGAGGALSGGVMGAGSQALGIINENNALNQYGKGIDHDYRELAQGIDTSRESYKTDADHQRAVDLQSLAQEYSKRQANKEFIPNRDKAKYEMDLMKFHDDYNQPDMPQTEQAVPTPKADNVAHGEPETTPEAPGRPEDSLGANPAEAYRKPYGKNGQTALMESYDGMIDIPTFSKAFGRAYDAGYHGIDQDIADRSAIMSVLDGDQFAAAYRAGVQDFNAENNIDLKTGKPKNMVQGPQKDGGLGAVAEAATAAQKKVAEHVGKMTGLKINLVDSLEQPGAVGSYKNGEITLSIDSNDFNGSLTHELTHHIKAYSPKGYKIFSDTVIDRLMQSQKKSFENIMEDYESKYSQAGQELTREQIREEVVADATQKFFNDPEFVDAVVKKDRTVAQRISDFLSDVVDSIKGLMKNGSTRTAAKGLEGDMRYYEDARDAWMMALADATETYKSGMEVQKEKKGNQEERNALERPDQVTERHIEENYGKVRTMEAVKELSGNEFGKGEEDLVTQVSDFYKSIGGKVHNDVVGDIFLDRDSVKDDMGHGIGRAKAITFAAVPDILRDGYVLDHEKNWKNRGYDSAVLGAKIKIVEGKYAGEYYGLAVVKVMDDNKMYLHEVYTIKAGDAVPFKTPDLEGGKTRSDTRNPPPIYSIFDKLLNVKDTGMDNGLSEKSVGKGIRNQLEDVDDTVTEKNIDAILHENQSLRDANALLQKQFELMPRSAVRKQDVERVADGLLKKHSSTYKRDTLVNNLDKLYEYIRGAENIDGSELKEAATSIAKSLLKQSQQLDTGLTQQYKELRDQIKNTKITLSDKDKADLASEGGYNAFRKRNFGRMKLGNDGIQVDSLYQELSEQHPELFPEDITHPADQLSAIQDALNQTDAQMRNPYNANMDEMSYMVGQDILHSYFDVRAEKPTYADRKLVEIERVKKEYSKKMGEYKANLKQDYENNLNQIKKDNIQKVQELALAYNNLTEAGQREQRTYYKEKMDSLRNEKNQALAAMQQKGREQAQKMRDRQRGKDAKKVIIKESKAMQNWLLKPTDTKHIPQSLRGAVADFLSNVDFSSNNDGKILTQRTEAWNRAKEEFENIIKNEGVYQKDDGGASYMEIDPDLIDRIKGITEKAKGLDKLDNLDAYSMEELKKTVLSMKKAITEANSLLSNKKSGELSILAEGVFKDLKNRKNRTEYAGMFIGKADKMLNYDMLDPQTMFGQMGKNVKSTYDALREGINKKTLKLMIAQKHVQELLKENNISYKDLREWSGAEAKPIKFQTSGGEVELTVSQVMSLYELNKRPQARPHMYDRTGGIKPAPRMGKLRTEDGRVVLPQIEKAYQRVRITEADLQQITSTLTPEQKSLADGLQRFMGNECAEWGNEVSMMMYGYEKFTAGNYFPIVTDDNYIHTTQGGFKDSKTNIKNLGFTKSTVMKANKPIIIEDILDVYSRQVDQMSTYNAYVTPLSDLNKVFNYIDMRGEMQGSSIKQEIERTFGKAGNEYINKLVEDVNGSLNTGQSIGDKLLSNMKAASVAGNLRVAIQQPTSYVRAAMEINPKYLLRGAATMTKRGQWETICQYAPIAQWKDWGFYRMDTSRQMKDIMFNTDSRTQRFVNKSMFLAEAGDKLAWNRLWRACEFECKDTHPELKEGTEDYYKEVGRRFEEIIDKTQVVDSVLHRTQIMRSEKGMDKVATSFMAESLKNYNMLYRAATDLKAGVTGSKTRAARAGAVFVVNAFATSVAAAVMDAMRDDGRDKKWSEKYKKAVWENLKDNANLLNNIPYVRDAYAVFDGYTPNRPDVAAYQDMYYAFNRLEKLAKGEGNLTPQAAILDAVLSSSKFLGSPAKGIARDAHALWDTAVNGLGNESADYAWLKQTYNMGSKKNLEMYAGMMIEANRNGNKDLEKHIKMDLNKAGIENDDISGKIKGLIKKELISKDSVHPLVDEAAQAKAEMDLDKYESDVNALMQEGYAGKLIESAIKSRMNQSKTGEETDWEAEASTDPDDLYGKVLTGKEGEDDWTPYSSGDILEAVEKFKNTPESLKTFNRVTQAIVDGKIKAGKTKEEAARSIKTSISKKYKADWIAAYKTDNRAEYEAIQKKLVCLKVNGKAIYDGSDLSKWREEARKK